MSPKESSGSPSSAPVGESQATSPSSTTTPQITAPPGSAVTANSVASTSRSVGATGASTNDNSTLSNIQSIPHFSMDLPLSTRGSVVGGISQNTPGPVVGSSAGQSRGGPAMAPIVVGSILGAISAIAIVVIVVLFFRQRRQANVTPNAIGRLDDDEDL